jgi:hypothetical protein
MITFKGIWTAFRSSVTGRFVKKKFAADNPDTTVREERKIYEEGDPK